jgi:hypothetical protein
MQSDWQVKAMALVGFATIIKTIPRTVSMTKRIPALLYIVKAFIGDPSQTSCNCQKASMEEYGLLWNKAGCRIFGFRFGSGPSWRIE